MVRVLVPHAVSVAALLAGPWIYGSWHAYVSFVTKHFLYPSVSSELWDMSCFLRSGVKQRKHSASQLKGLSQGGVTVTSTSEARPEKTVRHIKVKGLAVISGRRAEQLWKPSCWQGAGIRAFCLLYNDIWTLHVGPSYSSLSARSPPGCWSWHLYCPIGHKPPEGRAPMLLHAPLAFHLCAVVYKHISLFSVNVPQRSVLSFIMPWSSWAKQPVWTSLQDVP